MSRIIGIDLGTTNSLVGIWNGGKTELIPNVYGEYLTPSVVSVDDDGSILVGKIAKERLITHPNRTYETFKRSMGTNRRYGQFLAEELSAFVLKRLKDDAEAYLGEPVEEAVISVPAYFDDKARRATRNAGLLAGLRVERIINEPSAAALGFMKGLGEDVKSSELDYDAINGDDGESTEDEYDDRSFLVFDFGGGTLDVSIVDAFDNVVEIVSVSGDNMLGGTDFDKAIARYYSEEKQVLPTGVTDVEQNCILAAAEQVKRDLTENDTAVMRVNGGNASGSLEITNKDLLKISVDIFKKIYKVIETAMRNSGRMASELTDVILVGGSSKMPVVKHCLETFLERKDIKVVNPDQMIAIGMGVYAGVKERKGDVKDLILTDVCPFSLGTAVNNRIGNGWSHRQLMSFIIPRNTALPASKTQYYCTAGKQDKVVFDVLQGEEMYADMNRKIGQVEVDFKKEVEKGTEITTTYSYDLNGILVVDVEVPSLELKTSSILVDDNLKMSREEIDRRVKALEDIKKLSRDEEEDRQLFEWGERLFVQCPDYLREDLRIRLLYFEHILRDDVDVYRKPRIREYMKKYLLNTELSMLKYDARMFVKEDSWMDDEDIIIEKMIEDWDAPENDEE